MYDAKQALRNNIGMGLENRVPKDWLPKKSKVLEIGYGAGKMLVALEALGNECTGLEASQANYFTARHNGVKSNLLNIDVSNDKLPFLDGYFDTVIMLEVLEHVASPLNCIQEIRRVLRDGGSFIFSHPMPEKIDGYDVGKHSFPYPGLFEEKNIKRFLMQNYFSYMSDVTREEYHHIYLLMNRKVDRMNILDVVNNDVNENHLYNDLNWNY